MTAHSTLVRAAAIEVWTVGDIIDGNGRTPDDEAVVYVDDDTTITIEGVKVKAKANLIVAARDMVAALQSAEAYIVADMRENGARKDGKDAAQLTVIRTVIAKAGGGEPLPHTCGET